MTASSPLMSASCDLCAWEITDEPDVVEEALAAHREAHGIGVDACKIDGCDRPDAGRSRSWAGLCAEHVSEEAKRRASLRRSKREAPPGPPDPQRPPAPAPSPSIDALIETIRHRQVEVDTLRTQLRQAIDQVLEEIA